MANETDKALGKKTLILAEAERIFAEKGYYGLGLSELLKSCDVPKGSFYYYFESKHALFSSIVSETANLLENDILILLQQRLSDAINKFEYSAKISNILFPQKTEVLLLCSHAQGSSYQNFSKEYVNKLVLHPVSF